MANTTNRDNALEELRKATLEMVEKERIRLTSELAYLKGIREARGLSADSSMWDGPSKLSARDLQTILGFIGGNYD